MVFGITGQLCAGKNLVAATLSESGWLVIDEDAIGHEALEARREEIIASFGESVLDETGAISRKRLGSLVFGDPALLERLEAIVHPWMVAETSRRLAARSSAHAAVNAAILFRMGLHALCDRVIVVRAPALLRLIRCLRRDRLPVRQILARMATQRSLNRSPKGVDTVAVWNIGSGRRLERRVRRLVP